MVRTPASSVAVSAKAPPKDPEKLEIVLYPNPVLKKPARDLEAGEINAWLQAVAERMKKLMVDHEGVGLAAPQVGLSVRMLVWSPTGKPEDAKVLINPEISEEEGEVEGEEGCLSLPDIRAKIVRHEGVHVEGLDEKGQKVSLDLEGFAARIVQHENDHLEGVLILDRMSPVARLANRKKIKELEERYSKK